MIVVLVLLSVKFLGISGSELVLDFSASNSSFQEDHYRTVGQNLTLYLSNLPAERGFWVVQVHSYIHNVTVSLSPGFEDGVTVIGTHVGLVSDNEKRYYIQAPKNTLLYIAAVVYGPKDPMPGGCNLSFEVENAPYQVLSEGAELITVLSQPPKLPGVRCEDHTETATLEYYHLYLPAQTFDEFSALTGVKSMLTPAKIRENGRRVTPSRYYSLRYATYRGVGQVFAMIASHGGGEAAYVPTVSYSCDLGRLDTCKYPDLYAWEVGCVVLLVLGALMCFLGDFCPPITSVFCFMGAGALTGLAVALHNGAHLTYGGLCLGVLYALGPALLLVILVACIRSQICPRFPSPFLVITFIVSSFLVTSLFLFHLPGSASSAMFFTLFSIIIIIINWFSCLFPTLSHKIASAIVGAFCVVAAISVALNGTFQYVVFDVLRRAAIAGFADAVIDPPVHWQDYLYRCGFAALLALGSISSVGIWRKCRAEASVVDVLWPSEGPRLNTATESTPLLF